MSRGHPSTKKLDTNVIRQDSQLTMKYSATDTEIYIHWSTQQTGSSLTYKLFHTFNILTVSFLVHYLILNNNPCLT